MNALLYRELVDWYRLVDPPDEHRAYAADYAERLVGAARGPVATLLELGSGAGHNGVHMKERFTCTLTDLSEEMLRLSRELNPECTHVVGDMRTMRLGRTFDAVFVHDAVCYMATREDLLAAAETAFVHTRPGGAALFAPDAVRESFTEGVETEGGDDRERDRSLRYMMWTRDPDPNDETYVVDFAFLLREGTEVRAAHDQHVEGLFSRTTWLAILRGVGFEAEHATQRVEDTELDVFVCRKPA